MDNFSRRVCGELLTPELFDFLSARFLPPLLQCSPAPPVSLEVPFDFRSVCCQPSVLHNRFLPPVGLDEPINFRSARCVFLALQHPPGFEPGSSTRHMHVQWWIQR